MMTALCTIVLLSSLLSLITCNLLRGLEICPPDTEDKLATALELSKENYTLSDKLLTFYNELTPKLLDSVVDLESKKKLLQRMVEFRGTILEYKIRAADMEDELYTLSKDYHAVFNNSADSQSNLSNNLSDYIDRDADYVNPPRTSSRPPTISLTAICSKVNHSIKSVEKDSKDLEELANTHYFPTLFCYKFHQVNKCVAWMCDSILKGKKFDIESIQE